MNEPDTNAIPEANPNPDTHELDEAQAEEVAGGVDLCDADQYGAIAGSLTENYEKVVDFASHVIERVADGLNN